MGGSGSTFNGLISNFAATVMGIAGVIDSLLLACMAWLGVVEPQWQLVTLLILVSLMVMLIMRTLGGLFGWVALLFAAMLLLHYILPGLGQQS